MIPFSTKDPRNLPSEYSEYFVPQMEFDVSKKNAGQIKSLFNMIYSIPAKYNLEKLLNHIRPDVAHLHNIYGRISPSILPVLNKHKIPIVQTLHDSKLVCPNHRMFSNGSICEECKRGRFYKAILKRCSYGSAVLGAGLALEAYVHHWLNIYQKYVDVFISPSYFLKNKLVEHGMSPKKIFVLPNFMRISNKNSPPLTPVVDALYFGSLIPEKGVDVFIRSLRKLKGGRFQILGAGYMRDALERIAKDEVPQGGPTIEFVEHLDDIQLKKQISMSLMVIVPSKCYENAPMAILEAFSLGKPVVCSRIGGIPELISEGNTGVLFEPGNSESLYEKILELLSGRDKTLQMGRNAKQWVMKNRHPDLYFDQLMSLYNGAGVNI